MGIGWRRHGRGVGAHGSRLGNGGVCATDEALNRAANQPASNQTPVAAEAAPATRTNGAAAVGSQRTTA